MKRWSMSGLIFLMIVTLGLAGQAEPTGTYHYYYDLPHCGVTLLIDACWESLALDRSIQYSLVENGAVFFNQQSETIFAVYAVEGDTPYPPDDASAELAWTAQAEGWTAVLYLYPAIPAVVAEGLRATDACLSFVPPVLNWHFTTKDIYGNDVEGDVFTAHAVTMVNVWGTFCSPCISKMPSLGQLAQAYAEADFALIGLVSDAYDGVTVDEDTVEYAVEIVEATEAHYLHVVPNQALIRNLMRDMQYVPTTYFLDREGEVLGSTVGALSYDEWVSIIDGYLAQQADL